MSVTQRNIWTGDDDRPVSNVEHAAAWLLGTGYRRTFDAVYANGAEGKNDTRLAISIQLLRDNGSLILTDERRISGGEKKALATYVLITKGVMPGDPGWNDKATLADRPQGRDLRPPAKPLPWTKEWRAVRVVEHEDFGRLLVFRTDLGVDPMPNVPVGMVCLPLHEPDPDGRTTWVLGKVNEASALRRAVMETR